MRFTHERQRPVRQPDTGRSRTPLERTRTPALAGRGDRSKDPPRRRWRPSRSLRTTPAAPAPGRCGAGRAASWCAARLALSRRSSVAGRGPSALAVGLAAPPSLPGVSLLAPPRGGRSLSPAPARPGRGSFARASLFEPPRGRSGRRVFRGRHPEKSFLITRV